MGFVSGRLMLLKQWLLRSSINLDFSSEILFFGCPFSQLQTYGSLADCSGLFHLTIQTLIPFFLPIFPLLSEPLSYLSLLAIGCFS